MMPTLKQWYVTIPDVNYIGPCVLAGIVYGHPDFVDGSRIFTSPVLRLSDGVAHCQNRSYILEEPEEGLTEWLEEHGFQLGDYASLFRGEPVYPSDRALKLLAEQRGEKAK